MPRRVSMPAADDLFRPTASDTAGAAKSTVRAVPDAPGDTGDTVAGAEAEKKGASGRIRHDEKMTVYVTSEELLDLERTRLELRAVHGMAVDRGRMVREAIDLVLADFHEHGEASLLVRSLREE